MLDGASITGRQDPPSPLALRDNEAHLFFTFTDDAAIDGLVPAYERLISDDERERMNRFRFAKDRRSFLVTRALARCVLARYVSCDPRDLAFGKNEHGRPELAYPA